MDFFFRRELFQPGDRVLVAVSGGADSLSLLHALSHSREETGMVVEAAHVHHGMRGAEADADVEFLQTCCSGWDVPLHIEHRDVPLLAKERRISVETAGRGVGLASAGSHRGGLWNWKSRHRAHGGRSGGNSAAQPFPRRRHRWSGRDAGETLSGAGQSDPACASAAATMAGRNGGILRATWTGAAVRR